MTQTLRREIIQKFFPLLLARYYIKQNGEYSEEQIKHAKEFAGTLADAALEVSAIAKKAEVAKTGLDWAILGGQDVDQETQDENKLKQSAVNAFESAFGITRPWSNWWGIDKEWKDMLEFIAGEYRMDAECFKRYVLWYDDKGKFGGGMNATQIRRDPALFFTAWDMFKRQDVKPQAQPRKIYNPAAEPKKDYIPAPENLRRRHASD